MKKLLLLIIVSLVLVSVANAATVWNPVANGIVPPDVGNWNVEANWTNGVPGNGPNVDPNDTRDPKPVFNVDGAAECQVTDDQHYGGNLVQGEGGPGGVLRIMDGGTLTRAGGGWMAVGFNDTAKLIVEKGAVYDHAGHFWWGMHSGADSIVEINGGIVNGGASFGLGEWFGANPLDHGQCKVYINDGELNIHHWSGAIDSEHPVFWNDSFIDISFGKMVINNNSEAAAQAYIDAGKITGYGEVGNAQVVYADSVTTITAITDPLNRYPTMDETVAAGPLTLSWNNIQSVPPGNPVWVDVWFGTDPIGDPNNPEAEKDYHLVVDAALGDVDVPVSLVTDSTKGFYWQINTYAHGNPAHGIYDTGDDPNLSDWAQSVTEGMLMNFHAPNGSSCAGSGDLNCSGNVALDDVSYMAGVWLTADLTADIADPAGQVDVQDLLVVAQQWLDVSAEIAYLAFDETEGDIASDSSVNDYVGTLIDMDDSDWVGGNAGNALDFDGVDDYVALDDVFAEIAGRDLTISAWVKAPATNPNMQFIIAINSANGDGNKLLCGTPGNTATLSFGDTAWHHTTATVIDNTWHHIAFVLDDSANAITVYVDGSNVTSFTSTMSIATDDLLSLGQEYDPGLATGDFYSGQLDEVKVYDRALSEEEIAVLAQ